MQNTNKKNPEYSGIFRRQSKAEVVLFRQTLIVFFYCSSEFSLLCHFHNKKGGLVKIHRALLNLIT